MIIMYSNIQNKKKLALENNILRIQLETLMIYSKQSFHEKLNNS